ncbi:MAG: 16S rRNA (adenine(1518)-N(6)/adenine(1519)-N(6))-dimethyltransferase RsmA [Thermoplasmata archaeon]|nr:16S rRNA (adenine(1518)-N(6)/adenine(1519)-N(6))-dimethyltransferase RsmA [Thermoplasmata archaeon]
MLAGLAVRPSKGWGQSFLTDPFVADAEAALLDLSPGHPILEIGGGLGQLTAALLRRGLGPLTVVERDPRLARFLRRTFGHRITLLEGDALEVDLPPVDAAVGNLPYAVATPLLLRLFAARVPRIVFLVQEEVARRLAAGPGSKEYGRLSIIAQLYGSVELYRTVPPSAFTPVPEVTSRLGVHEARVGTLPVPSVPAFEEVVRTLFSSRRKQLRNLMPRVVPSAPEAERLLRQAGWPDDWPGRRPETLPPEAYFSLARELAPRANSG